MLDANLTAQLKTYLANIRQPIELVAAADEGAKSRQMLTLLDEIAALSPDVTVTRGDDARVPSFLIRRTGTDIDNSGLRQTMMLRLSPGPMM